MTKNEATEKGKAAGTEAFAASWRNTVTPTTDFDEMKRAASLQASVSAALAHVTSNALAAYVDAFAAAFVAAGWAEYWSLPEVKAEARKRSAERWIADALESFAASRDRFVASLNENALYTLEWSESMFDAAAKQAVALNLQAILQHENGGVDKAAEEATRYALQGARSPKQSTSGTSNLADRYKTAAYAEFVDHLRYS